MGLESFLRDDFTGENNGKCALAPGRAVLRTVLDGFAVDGELSLLAATGLAGGFGAALGLLEEGG